jgi:8-oxo-dGTP diphosphatase
VTSTGTLPKSPSVGVGGVLLHRGRVLLIKRGKQPLRGRWVVPGGTVELGESLEEALVREMEEETGIQVRPVNLLTAFDRIDRDGSEVRYHYVIVDYLCEYLGGEARAASDAQDVAWAAEAELPAFDLPDKALEVVKAAFRLAEGAQLPGSLSQATLLR